MKKIIVAFVFSMLFFTPIGLAQWWNPFANNSTNSTNPSTLTVNQTIPNPQYWTGTIVDWILVNAMHRSGNFSTIIAEFLISWALTIGLIYFALMRLGFLFVIGAAIMFILGIMILFFT